MEELLGPVLIQGDQELSTKDALRGKVVCFYFSAHWCPPCRSFTPDLAKFYTSMKAQDKNIEIVFVSSDNDEAGFKEYFKEMPWLALPYSERDKKGSLSSKYKVGGIPTLVVIAEDGKVITKNGRTEVDNDPEGAKFPWIPPPINEVLGTEFVNTSGDTVLIDTLAGKHLAIYFSAHWCPPCKAFTPVLNTLYNKIKESKNWEIIFASSDKDQSSFDEYFKGSMSWLAIPFADRERKNALSQMFGVTGIPCLVMLSPDLTIINSNARLRVPGDIEGEEFPWGPKPLVTLDDDPSDINDFVSILFIKGDLSEADAAPVLADLTKLGQASLDKVAAGGDKDNVFFVSNDSEGKVSKQLITALQFDNPGRSALVLLDIPSGGLWYELSTDAPKAGDVQKLIDAHAAGSLEKQVLE